MRPSNPFQRDAQLAKAWYILGFQALGQFLLDAKHRPEILARMLRGRLKEVFEHLLERRMLLIVGIMRLYLALILAGKPVDAVALAEFAHGLGKHLPVGNGRQHIHLALHLHAEIAA